MSALNSAFERLGDDLLDAIGRQDWTVADAELETLAQEAVAAMVANRRDDLAALARVAARCHTALSLHDDPGGEAMHRQGQLRALAVIIAAARGRTPPRPDKALSAPGTATAAVLTALKTGPQTCPALVEATGLSAEQVGGALPELRAAGLIRSWPAGRLTVNALQEGDPLSPRGERENPP
jgi:predicted Rossmann fold nucleotide-binding protein DprA/Smf involved in DNA uptake